MAPAELGRGLVIGAQDAIPEGWTAAEIVLITATDLTSLERVVTRLHRAWLRREPVVIRLSIDPRPLRTPETWNCEPYQLSPGLPLWRERLHFLLWANNWDGRRPDSWRWAWSGVARRDLGAGPSDPPDGDVTLANGQVVWLDGGPRQPLPSLTLPVVHWETLEAGRLEAMPDITGPAEDGLAPDQAAAVAHLSGPARVIAPAGSGKTRVLTARLRHLLVDRGYERDKVLAVAYNVRAKNEMLARTQSFSPRVQTLNALGYEIVREAWGGAEVLGELEVRNLLGSLLPDLQRRVNTDPLLPYIDGLSAIRQRLRAPALVEAEAGEDEELEGLAALFPAYRRVLRERRVVDFDEQLYGAVEALLQDGDLRQRWQRRSRHLLVDEFQDLTPLHLLLIRLLSLPGLDVFGVGDDDQVIYGYSGADPGFLIHFKDHFPGAQEYALQVNYRCPEPVVTAASQLLAHNLVRVTKTIRARADAPSTPRSLRVVRHAPGQAVASLIAEVTGWIQSGVKPAQMAVLTRVNALLLAPQVALLEGGVPVNSTLGPRLLERTGVRSALAYLRLAAAGDEMETADLQLVYRRPDRKLPFGFGDLLGGRERWSVAQLRQIPTLPRGRDALHRLTADLSRLQSRHLAGFSSRDLLVGIRTEIGLGTAMAHLDSGQVGDLTSHIDDLEALEQVAILHPATDGFEAWLRGAFRTSSDPEGVVLATVHKTKGQEWPRVCVYAASEGLMPHRLAVTDSLEEERRIMHVALTRGQEEVLIIAPERGASRFIGELLGQTQVRMTAGPSTTPSPLLRSATVTPRRDEIRPEMGESLVLAGGYAGVVVQVDAEGVSVKLPGGSQLRARWGEQVARGTEHGALTRAVATAGAGSG